MSKASELAAYLKDVAEQPFHDAADLLLEQEKALREAEKTIDELIIDQEVSVRSEYNYPAVHPAMQKKFERDMASVNDARKVLSAIRKVLSQ
jgi:hypothetical protein